MADGTNDEGRARARRRYVWLWGVLSRLLRPLTRRLARLSFTVERTLRARGLLLPTGRSPGSSVQADHRLEGGRPSSSPSGPLAGNRACGISNTGKHAGWSEAGPTAMAA